MDDYDYLLFMKICFLLLKFSFLKYFVFVAIKLYLH